nr:unnamed protein product [Spirometra erinaceieuropaei]
MTFASKLKKRSRQTRPFPIASEHSTSKQNFKKIGHTTAFGNGLQNLKPNLSFLVSDLGIIVPQQALP